MRNKGGSWSVLFIGAPRDGKARLHLLQEVMGPICVPTRGSGLSATATMH